MRFNDKTIASVEELIAVLQERYNPLKDTIWFRGHANSSWSLTPSLYRAPFKLKHEQTLLTRFQQNALPLLEYRPASTWEWLFLLQHHRCPTRLLDWTESPLVALYFACENLPTLNRYDGHLWSLSPTELNAQWGMVGSHVGDIPAFGSPYLEEYSTEKISTAQGIKKPPAAAIATREVGRMMVQQSVFTVHHVRTEPIESYGDNQYVWRLVIPSKCKASIRKKLATLGISRLSVFPDLDSVGQLARESVK